MTRVRSFFKNDLFYELLFFAFAFLCMAAFIFIQPFGEGPDEINRFRVVWYIAQTGRLPRGDDPARADPRLWRLLRLSAHADLHPAGISAVGAAAFYGSVRSFADLGAHGECGLRAGRGLLRKKAVPNALSGPAFPVDLFLSRRFPAPRASSSIPM